MAAADPKPVKVKPIADVVNLLLMPAQLILMKGLIDRIQLWSGGAVVQDLVMTACFLAAVMIVQAVIGRASLLSYNRLMEIGAYEVEHAILVKSSKLSLARLESPSLKELRTRALNVAPDQLFLNGIGFLLQAPQMILLLTILCWYGQWLVVMMFIILLPIQFILRNNTSQAVEKLNRQQTPQRTAAEYISRILTSRRSAKEIRLFGLAEELQSRWMRLHQATGLQWIAHKKKEQLMLAPSELVVSLVSGLLAAIVLVISAAKGQSAGEIAVLLQIAIMLGGMWPGLLDQYAVFKQQTIRWGELRQFVQLDEDPVYTGKHAWERVPLSKEGSTLHMDKLPKSVLVRQLSFTYEGSRQKSIHNVHFHIEAGEKVAIVGENGAGKSTLVKLLTGLYTPDSGTVDWYSRAGTKLSAAEAAERFTAVMQDFTKMSLTVREQVALGSIRRLNDDEKLLGALAQANASQWELDENIGPEFGGIELSGGQWQRLAAARAYIREGSVLFFDEPTSALDPQAERAAMEDFFRIAGERTAFLVTHRLGAAWLADRILVLRQGELIEQGTHDQLMAKCGEYERLYRMQASWYV
ncbi:ABC transporter ATP-binding protein [Paenibacillus sp. H1-7]|uniref:ABC transporter ATP-binding protein n=1 Tax=Paenibacillus sp. H1-7 TaxID=2282849 RepID=UPI001EF861E9|nr:ABC transporter ATP-binding protein [Paenibacillus sp. H1-7]ULL17233.1 ABC transporter ATP-binding protein [Paenibacillus sp. H1-7]